MVVLIIFSAILLNKFEYNTMTWVGNFIIGANGSDKQMLCGSSIERVAQTISAVNRIQKG